MGHSYSVDQIHKIEYDTLVVKRGGQLKPRWSSHDTVTEGVDLYSTLPPKNSGRYKRRRIYASTDATVLADEMSGYMKGSQLSASADLSDPDNTLPMKGNYKRRRFLDTSAEINSEHSLSPIIPHSGKVKVRRRLITTNHPDNFAKNRLVVSADFTTAGPIGAGQPERPVSCNPIVEETPEEIHQKGETVSLDSPYKSVETNGKQPETRKANTFQLGQRRQKRRREPGEKARDHRDSTSSYESAMLHAKPNVVAEPSEVQLRNRRIAINFMLGPFSIPTEASQLEYEKSTTLVVNSVRQVTANKTGEYGEIELGYCEYYEPGDYVFIRPRNDVDSVQRVAKLLGLEDKTLDQHFTVSLLNEPAATAAAASADSQLRFRTPTTMRKFLTEEVDLSGPPNMEFLEELGREVPLTPMLEICSHDRKAYWKWVTSARPSLLDVLGDLDNLPPVEFLLQSAPLIEPRCYLASSSGEGSVCICYRTEEIGSRRLGLASKYLQTLEPGMRVTSAVSVGSALTLPENNSLPVVMIAEYVGIAPFRGFLDAKKLGLIRGRLYLLYEFNKSSEAAYFRTISTYAGTGVLTDVVLAPKVDKRMTPGDALAAKLDDIRWRTLLPQLVGEQNCQVFLCGSDQFCDAVRKLLARLLHLPTSDYFLKAYWLHEERIRSNLAITRANSDFQFTSSQSTLSRGGRQSRTSELAEQLGRAETPQDSLGRKSLESARTITYATDGEAEVQQAQQQQQQQLQQQQAAPNDTIVIQQTIRVLRQETSFTSFKGQDKDAGLTEVTYDVPKSAGSTLKRDEQYQREIAQMKTETIGGIKREFGSEYDNLNEEEPSVEQQKVIVKPQPTVTKTEVVLAQSAEGTSAVVPIVTVVQTPPKNILFYDNPDAHVCPIPFYLPPEKPSKVAELMTKIEPTSPPESLAVSPESTLTRGTLSRGKVYNTPLVWVEEVQPYSPVLIYDNPTRGLIGCSTMERASQAERLKRAITSPDRSRKQTRSGFVAVTDYYTRTLELPPDDQIETVVLRNSSNWSIGRASYGRHSGASSAASSHDGESLKGTGRWSMRDSLFRGKKKEKKADKRRSDVSATQPSGSVSWLNGRVSPNLHAELCYDNPTRGLCDLQWEIIRTESEHKLPIVTISDMTKEFTAAVSPTTVSPPTYARIEPTKKSPTKAVSSQTEEHVYENYRTKQMDKEETHVYDMPPVETTTTVEKTSLVESSETTVTPVTQVQQVYYSVEPLGYDIPTAGLIEEVPREEKVVEVQQPVVAAAAQQQPIRTIIVHYRDMSFDDPSRGLVDVDSRVAEINRRDTEYIPETYRLARAEPFGPATNLRPIFFYENLGYDDPTRGLIEPQSDQQPTTSIEKVAEEEKVEDRAGLTLFLKKTSTTDERYEVPPPSRTLIVNQFTVSPDNPLVLAQMEKDFEVAQLRKLPTPDKDEVRLPTFIPFEQPGQKRLSQVEQQRREINIQSPVKEAPSPRIIDVGQLPYDNPTSGLFPLYGEGEKQVEVETKRGRTVETKVTKESRQRSRSAAAGESDEQSLEQSSSTTDLSGKPKKKTLTDRIKRAFSPVTHRKKMNREAEILTTEEPLGPLMIRYTMTYADPTKGLSPLPEPEIREQPVPVEQKVVVVPADEQPVVVKVVQTSLMGEPIPLEIEEEEIVVSAIEEEPFISVIEEKVTTVETILRKQSETAEADEFLFPYSKKDYRSSLQYEDPMANLVDVENLPPLQKGPSSHSVDTQEKKKSKRAEGRHTIHIFGHKTEEKPAKEGQFQVTTTTTTTEVVRPADLVVKCEPLSQPAEVPAPITPKNVSPMSYDLQAILSRTISQPEPPALQQLEPSVLRSDESDAAQLFELKTVATEPQPRDTPKADIVWLTQYDNPSWGLVDYDYETHINVESVGPLKAFKPLTDEEEIVQVVVKPIQQEISQLEQPVKQPHVFSTSYGIQEGEYDNIEVLQTRPTESKIILDRLQQLEVSAELPAHSTLLYDDPMAGLIGLDPYEMGGTLKSIIKSPAKEKSQSSAVSFSETSVVVDTQNGTDSVERLKDEENQRKTRGQKSPSGQPGILTKIRSMSPPRFFKGSKKVAVGSTPTESSSAQCEVGQLQFDDPSMGLFPTEDVVVVCEEIETSETHRLKKASLPAISVVKTTETSKWPRERSRSADELDGLDELSEPSKSPVQLSESVEDLPKLLEQSEREEVGQMGYLTQEEKEKHRPEFIQKFKRVFSSPVFGRRSYSVERAAKEAEKHHDETAVTPSKLPVRVESGKEAKTTEYEFVEAKSTELIKPKRGKKGKKPAAVEVPLVPPPPPVNVDLSLSYEQPLGECEIPVAEVWQVASVPTDEDSSVPHAMVQSDHQLSPKTFEHSGVDSQIAIVQSAEVSVVIKNTITYQTSRQLDYESPSGFVEMVDTAGPDRGDPNASPSAQGQPHAASSVDVMLMPNSVGTPTDESTFRGPTEADLPDHRHRIHSQPEPKVVDVVEESRLQTFQSPSATTVSTILTTSTPALPTAAETVPISTDAEIAASADAADQSDSPESDYDADFSYSCTRTTETHNITMGDVPLDWKIVKGTNKPLVTVVEEHRRLVADIPKFLSIAYEDPLEGLCQLPTVSISEVVERKPLELGSKPTKLTSYDDPTDGLQPLSQASPAPADPDIKELTYLSHSYMGRLVRSIRSLERNGKNRKVDGGEMPEDPHPSKSAELLCLPFDKLSGAGKRRLPSDQIHHSQTEISSAQVVSLAKRPRSYNVECELPTGHLATTGLSDFVSLDESVQRGSYDLPPGRPSHSPPQVPRRISNNFDSPLTIRRKETAATKVPIFIRPVSRAELGQFSVGTGHVVGGAVVLGTRHLLIGRDVEETHEVSLSLAGVTHTHQPGDLIAISPMNMPDRVADLFLMYGIDDPEQMFVLDMASPKRLSFFESEDGDDIYSRPVNFRTVFTRYLDLSGPPSVELLRAIDSEIGGLPVEFRAACKDVATYGDWVDRFRPDIFTVFRLLEMHQRLFPSLELLLTLLPRIKPRHYYITSADNGRITFNFKTIRIDNMRLGLATNYLLYLKPKATVSARIVPNLKLRPPVDPNTPMILMAGDLGITALRALWETQKKDGRPGRLLVLYEVKRPQCSLYWAELNMRKREGIVSDTLLANCESGYDLIKELQRSRKWKKEIHHMMALGAHVYVAGSAGFCEKVRNYLAGVLATDSMNLHNLEVYHEESGCYAEPL